MGHCERWEGQRLITLYHLPLDGKHKWLQEPPKNLFTNLSDIYQVGIFPSSGSIGGEDGSSISIWVVIYNLDGFIQSVRLQNHKNWTKNLLFVTSHIWLPGVMHPEKKSVFNAYLVLYYPRFTWTAFMFAISVHFKSFLSVFHLARYQSHKQLEILIKDNDNPFL